jgi:uncharacterized protein (DUF1501 family)
MSHFHPKLNFGRRNLLKGGAALIASGMMPRLMMSEVQAAGLTGYRALVCVFMYGGNDSNNMIIPMDTTGYNNYATARTPQSSGGLALTQASLVPLTEKNGTVAYAMHPNMPELAALYHSGQLATLYNVGSLVGPLTKAQYLSPSTSGLAYGKPINLFSHEDQQFQQQATALDSLVTTTGWGGRMADVLASVGGALPMNISIAGNATLLGGASTQPLSLPNKGTLNVSGFDTSAAGMTRQAAYLQMASQTSSSVIVQSFGVQQGAAVALAGNVNPVLALTNTISGAAFTGMTSSLSLQLAQVARLIENRANLGNPTRQLFFVSVGGSFDTHSNQIAVQGPLLADVSASLNAFNNALGLIAAQSMVTTFTLSDFTRTLKPASDGGSDHAWGGHHMIMGGAVNGGQAYGTYPQLILNGPDDVTNTGRWLPTTSVDQYAATLATWFGLSTSQLATVFPNLKNFTTPTLNFMSA